MALRQWFTVKHTSDDEDLVVTAWGRDERPLRIGARPRSVADVIAFHRFLAGPGGSTLPRCSDCGAAVDVPRLDSPRHFEEAA